MTFVSFSATCVSSGRTGEGISTIFRVLIVQSRILPATFAGIFVIL